MGYPIHLVNLSKRRVLVAGAGRVAAGKLPALIASGARVQVIAESFDESIAPYFEQIDREQRAVSIADVAGAALVIAATDDREVNRAIAEEARRLRILVNAVDDPEACDFFAPAIVERGPVTIAISTEGTSPLLAGQLRRMMEAILPASLKSAADILARARKNGLRGLARRSSLLRALADARLSALVDRGDTEAASERLESIAREEPEPFPPGSVAIVGAGPGAKELLTLRALDRIQRADVLLHDALVDAEILTLAHPDTRVIDVGRRAEGCKPKQFTQRLTEELMIEEARKGSRVVRLHAGDPLVFGRGGEEIDALNAAGVPFEVVPGVSSVMAAASAASVPLTRRGESRGFSVRTGHDAGGYTRGELPIEAETTVVLMGLGAVRQIMEGLIAEGRAPETPAMAVSKATLPDQRVVVATIATLADEIEAAKLEGPAALIVGETVKRAASEMKRRRESAA